MKAAQITQYGGASVVTINEIERPAAGPGEVLVEVRAASLNPFDTVLRQGYLSERIPLTFPVTLGGDIAGVVAEVGEGVEGLNAGDAVYGQAAAVAGASGAFAEYARTAADRIARAPKNLDFKESASLVLVGVSALQALTKHISLKAGQTIFIHGGAGGIGSVAIQIARHIGARVITTARGDNIRYVKDLGADEAIDYQREDFTRIGRDIDAALDLVGGDDLTRILGILRRGGVAVTTVGPANATHAQDLGVSALMQFTDVTTGALDPLRDLVERGVVTPHIGKVFLLGEARKAFIARESHMRGKVVLEIVESGS